MLSSATTCLWKSFRRSRTQFRDRPETVRLHPGTGVHLHPGILFGINPERRSESSRNRVHLAPDSPKRRALAAGLPSSTCCHTFRATGITAYLENGGTIENAQAIAAHESPRTTKLYDRTSDEITLDEVERIVI